MEKELSSLQQTHPGMLSVFGVPCPSRPWSCGKALSSQQPFGVRIGVSELALGRQCGLSPGCFCLHSSAWGGKNPQVGSEVKSSGPSCISPGWQEHVGTVNIETVDTVPSGGSCFSTTLLWRNLLSGAELQDPNQTASTGCPGWIPQTRQLCRVGDFCSPG